MSATTTKPPAFTSIEAEWIRSAPSATAARNRANWLVKKHAHRAAQGSK